MFRVRPVRKVALRCFAYPDRMDGREGYRAQCIDLDLLVWRPTFPDAKRELDNQIRGYMQEIKTLQEFDALVPRRAPLSDRILYHLVHLMVLVHKQARPKVFELPYPKERALLATPA